jgi:hypothetical protein
LDGVELAVGDAVAFAKLGSFISGDAVVLLWGFGSTNGVGAAALLGLLEMSLRRSSRLVFSSLISPILMLGVADGALGAGGRGGSVTLLGRGWEVAAATGVGEGVGDSPPILMTLSPSVIVTVGKGAITGGGGGVWLQADVVLARRVRAVRMRGRPVFGK